MSPLTIPLRIGAGLAAGALVGIERGWKLKKEKPGTRVAGVRTFTLLGLAGAIAGQYPNSVTTIALLWLAARREWLRGHWAGR